MKKDWDDNLVPPDYEGEGEYYKYRCSRCGYEEWIPRFVLEGMDEDEEENEAEVFCPECRKPMTYVTRAE